jgi:hypothetical protein
VSLGEGSKPYTSGESISDIALGDLSGSIITLSGTIGDVTVDGGALPPWYFVVITAIDDQNGVTLGSSIETFANYSWSIYSIDTALASTNSIRFQAHIYTEDDSWSLDIPAATQNYDGISISDIELGNLDFTTDGP